MKPPVETVRVSRRGRDQLVKIRRVTGIENWNVICRWAICASMREPSVPPVVDKEGDNAVELTWRTFAGDYSEVLVAAHLMRFESDKKHGDKSEVSENFRRHLYRGLNFLDARLEIVDGRDLITSLIGKVSDA
jgi:DNA sulfur modification protein DndE